MKMRSPLVLPDAIRAKAIKDLAPFRPAAWLTIAASDLDERGDSPAWSIRGVKRYLALRMFDPSWSWPLHGTDLAKLGDARTQFLLCDLGGGRYALVLPVPDGDDCCTLRGGPDGLRLHVEGALPGGRKERVRAALVTWGEWGPIRLIGVGHRPHYDGS